MKKSILSGIIALALLAGTAVKAQAASPKNTQEVKKEAQNPQKEQKKKKTAPAAKKKGVQPAPKKNK